MASLNDLSDFKPILDFESIEDQLKVNDIDPDNFKIVSTHNHSYGPFGSKCANSKPAYIAREVNDSIIDILYVTDHNTVENYFRDFYLRSSRSIKLGGELRTAYGEIALLNIPDKESFDSLLRFSDNKNKDIMAHLGEIVRDMKIDDLVIGMVHPFSSSLINGVGREGFDFEKYLSHLIARSNGNIDDISFFLSYCMLNEYEQEFALKYKTFEEAMEFLTSQFDFVEFNTANMHPSDNYKAVKLARKYDVPLIVGEDSHFVSQIGKSGLNLINTDMTFYDALSEKRVVPVVRKDYPLASNKLLIIPSLYRMYSGILKKVRR